jgi:ADP-ribose pyrophosphatase YjhB (NUDIX family)
MDDPRWESGMPVLARQTVRTPSLPPSLRGLPPRSVPETRPTPLQRHYVLLSVVVLFAGAIAITALEFGAAVRADRRAAAGCDDGGRDASHLAIGVGMAAGEPWSGPVPAGVGGRGADGPDRAGGGIRADPRGMRPVEDPRALARLRGPDARSTDIDSGLGMPAWMGSQLNHCSRCGSPLRLGRVDGEERERLVCEACGHVSYVNPRLVVTTIPITGAGDVVLLRRGIEPGRGSWAQPGGFLEVDETLNEGAIRETLEETGLLVDPGELIGLYTRLEAAVVVLAFEARITGGEARLTPEALEIRTFAPDAIPWSGIAFSTTTWALRDWLSRRHPDVHLGADGG